MTLEFFFDAAFGDFYSVSDLNCVQAKFGYTEELFPGEDLQDE